MIEKSKIVKVIENNPLEGLKAAYLMLSSINYITMEHGEQENTVEAINIIDSIFYDAINFIEKAEEAK
ncbi:hypothetical protein [Halarcobacter anaerophilus]|uniref:hypothetical protein n=1 Tax=Halarcobacter anaerophilus TaxID=877500 RepID=UPI0005CA0FE4|nr:hypothetical protein [Halarcobacter anaerophilus]